DSLTTFLRNSAVPYERAVAAAATAQASIATLLQGVDDMQALLGDEQSGIAARLARAEANEARVRSHLRENAAVLRCLRVLASLNADLRAMDALVRSACLDRAAAAVLGLERDLREATAIHGTRISRVLADRVAMARANIAQNAQNALHRLLDIRTDDASAAQMRLSDAPAAPLLAALDALACKDAALAAFGSRFVQSYVRPLLASSCIERDGLASNDRLFAMRCRPATAELAATSAPALCDAVAGAFAFASRALPGEPWPQQCLADAAAMVLDRCLLRCLPTTRSDLARFRDTTAPTLLDFEARLFADHSGPSSPSPPECRPISDALRRIDELFARGVCDRALCRARALAEDSRFEPYDLAAHEIWSLDLVCHFLSADAAPRLAAAIEQLPPLLQPPPFPKCLLSRNVKSLVSEAYVLANEAALALDSAPHLAAELVHSAACLFDVYRALFLTLHRAQLTKIPALAWQFFNDCVYAAHHTAILARLAPLLAGGSEEWLQCARLFLTAGQTHIATLVAHESNELVALANSARDAFYAAAADTSKSRLAKSASQLRLALAQLARAMHPPLVTPRVFYRSLARYLDAVFAATIQLIVDLRDIGVDDSQALSDHCRSLHALTDLLQLDPESLAPYSELMASAVSNVAVEHDELLGLSGDDGRQPGLLAAEHCSLADKLLQLADILLISRADILARRRAGLLAQFSTDELVGLIRALFSDTKERARDIDELKSMAIVAAQ
ncbi:ribosome biogenesis protein ytm1, partial [Coemansia sp. RSA 2320]